MDIWRLLMFVLLINVFSAIFNNTLFTPLFNTTQPVLVGEQEISQFKSALNDITQTQADRDIPQGLAMIWGFLMSIPILSQLIQLLYGLPILIFRFANLFLPWEISLIISWGISGILTLYYANALIQLLRGIRVS